MPLDSSFVLCCWALRTTQHKLTYSFLPPSWYALRSFAPGANILLKCFLIVKNVDRESRVKALLLMDMRLKCIRQIEYCPGRGKAAEGAFKRRRDMEIRRAWIFQARWEHLPRGPAVSVYFVHVLSRPGSDPSTHTPAASSTSSPLAYRSFIFNAPKFHLWPAIKFTAISPAAKFIAFHFHVVSPIFTLYYTEIASCLH